MLTEAPPAGALLARLRFVTRPAHDRLEGALGLLDERLGLDAYRRVLERFYGFWRGWEPQVATLFQDAAFLGPRRRLHLLRADLATVGLSARAARMLPACPLPVLRGAAEALGSLYVMEGSTLGGQVIERNVERCLGLDGRCGCTYFAGYGTDTGRMWRLFLARLDLVPVADAERVADGAVATFERLAWWLPGTGQPPIPSIPHPAAPGFR